MARKRRQTKTNVSLNEEMLTVNLHIALKNALGASSKPRSVKMRDNDEVHFASHKINTDRCPVFNLPSMKIP